MSARSRAERARRGGPRRRRPRRPDDRPSRGRAAGAPPRGRQLRRPGAPWRPCSSAPRIDAILHCAARSLVGESVQDPAQYYRDNVAGGVALLEAARGAGVGRIVFSSTAAVYGVPDATPIPEDAPLRPINTYGETKRTFEGALRWYGEAYGLRSVSCATSTSPARPSGWARSTDPRPTSSRTRSRRSTAGAPLTLFGDDYPTPDGTSDPRLHPRRGSGRRAPARARARPASRAWTTRRRTAHLQSRAPATGSRCGTSLTPRSAWSARRSSIQESYSLLRVLLPILLNIKFHL